MGNLRAEELRYVPALPPHVLSVEPGDADPRGMESAARGAAAELPGGSAHIVREPLRPARDGTSEAYLRQLYLTPDPGGCEDGCTSGTPAIAGSDAFNAIAAGRRLNTAERESLESGSAIVFDPSLFRDGRIEVEQETAGGEMRTVALPARLVRRDTPYTSLPSALIPLDVAREQKLGGRARPARSSATTPRRRRTRSAARSRPPIGSALPPTSRRARTTARASSRC